MRLDALLRDGMYFVTGSSEVHSALEQYGVGYDFRDRANEILGVPVQLLGSVDVADCEVMEFPERHISLGLLESNNTDRERRILGVPPGLDIAFLAAALRVFVKFPSACWKTLELVKFRGRGTMAP